MERSVRTGQEKRSRASRRLAALAASCCLALGGAAPAEGARGDVEDGDITRAIESDLWVDGVVDANAVDVLTRQGVVTLTGSVPSLLARDRAEAIAESIVGVRAIVNRIEVSPTPRDDASLSEAVEEALQRDPATDSYEVDVAAAQGTVTLTGTVDSWSERELCETVATGVRGVRRVRNQLEIEEPPERPDPELAAEVQARLANDVHIDAHAITVTATEGEIALSGRVGSLAEKRLARANSWVAGVRSVDDDGLEVHWWARDGMRRRSWLQGRPDDAIEKAVRDALFYDPRVASFDVNVHASNGVVTLTGIVDNAAAKRAAESDARNVAGAWGVRNHLKVRPEVVPPDDVLERRVERALADDPYVDRWDVDVAAFFGKVHLTGTVNSSFEKGRAEERAARVRGVTEVVNRLAYDHEWEWKPDWEIRVDVKDQLFWSPFVDSDAVKVNVDNGVVTLTGEVDSWAERADAAKNAWEGGAKDVRNEIVVSYEISRARSPVPVRRVGSHG